MKDRGVIVVGLALVVAVLVVRDAFVAAYATREPARAAALWPSHPSVIFASGLDEVGRTAASGRPVDKAIVERLLVASAKAPLAPEPFLVRGVEAQVAGNEALAERAFLEARHRDSRSVAARYFLADLYLRAGQTRQGLGEISALARLVPQSLDGIAPYLAAYALSPGGAPEVKAMIRNHPELEPLLLNALAADAGNDRLAMFLWSGRNDESARGWQERLLNSLVAAGRFEQARSAWARFSSVADRQEEPLDADFESRSLPPFGWTLVAGPAGVAEPEGGRLHILYYGRDDLVLANRLLMLKPGSHRLSMRVTGVSRAAKSLAWTIRCLPSTKELAAVVLAEGSRGVLAADFVVPPAGCAAQRLELIGTAPELPEQADITIADLRLERGAGR